MARTMWKGAMQFGLVVMPVALSIATESRAVAFHMLHAACGMRVQMRTWCPEHDIAISRSDTVKGIEIAPDRCVPLTEEDLEGVPLKTVREIVIDRFVPLAEVAEAARFPDQSYYVRPELVARRAFSLFASTIARRRVAAVCKVVLTNRERLALLRVFDGALLLTTLHWPDEVREPDIRAGRETFTAAERAAADALVTVLAGPFDPSAYRDEYRESLLTVIERKVAGLAQPVADAASPSPIDDLMAVLQASVEAARVKRPAPAVVPPRPAQAATAPGQRIEARAAPAKARRRGPRAA